MSHELRPGERIVRHPNGHLIVERFDPVPTEADTDKAFTSLAKAWPVVAKHADHMDGEFDLALDAMRRYVARFREVIADLRTDAASRPPSTDGPSAAVSPSPEPDK